MLEANNQGENQIFLYEVVFSGSSGSWPQRFSRTVLRVPKSRMSQETQRLLRQGAKILSIKPLDQETVSIKPSLPPPTLVGRDHQQSAEMSLLFRSF